MSTVKSIAATVNGLSISNLFSFCVGETVNIYLTCNDPSNTSAPLNLTSLAVIMSIDCYDTTGKSIRISRTANITNAALGQCTIPISSNDTYVSTSSICYPGKFAADIWAEDVPGNRIDLGFGTVAINPAVRLPGAVITPLPSQQPLAKGDKGDPGTGGNGIAANDFPGADIGAKINAAMASLSGAGGTVFVRDGDYAVTTKFVIETNVTLVLGVGTYSNAWAETFHAPILLKDGASLIGSGWGTRVMNIVCSSQSSLTVADYVSGLAGDNAAAGNSNIVVRDIQFIGNPASTTVAESATVQFANTQNVLVDHCYFNGCDGYGVYQASSSSGGHYANGFVVQNCTFENVKTQQTGAINCINWFIRDNLFKPTTTTNNYTVIDCESNTGTDTLRNGHIIGNTFDLSASPIYNPGAIIQVIGGSATPYSAGRGYHIEIVGNVCIGGNPGHTLVNGGINLNYCDHSVVADNQMHHVMSPIGLANCFSCTVKDNVTGTGTSNDSTHIFLASCFDCVVDGNKCIENNGGSNSTPSIVELYGGDYNIFTDNVLSFYPTASLSDTGNRYCRIDLIGVNSRAFGNTVSTIPVDAPLVATVAELQALEKPGTRDSGHPAVVVLGGYAAQGDGGFSVWRFDPASTATANAVTVVKPTVVGAGAGRWLRAPGTLKVTTTVRDSFALTTADAGLTIWNTSAAQAQVWDGTQWVAATGGGGSTGNWTFTGNNADLSGAGAMQLGNGTATSVKIVPTTVSLTSGAAISATSRGATNTTGLTLSPNIASGTTGIGLLVNTGTTLTTTDKVLSLQNNSTNEVYWNAAKLLHLPINSQIDGDGLFITGGTNPINIGASAAQPVGFAATNVTPGNDAALALGGGGTRRWSAVWSYWYDTKVGAQLTAAATITPTCGVHHVTGATTINIIATTNVPASTNVILTIIADSTVNFGTSVSAGGIKIAPTALTSGKAMQFFYDSSTTFWFPVQGG